MPAGWVSLPLLHWRDTLSAHYDMSAIVARNPPPQAVQHLIDTGMTELLARIFAARGIDHSAQLETGLERLLPYAQLKHAQHMATILADAIAARRKLLIVADYDADGATACALGVRGLSALGAQVGFIVPNRFEYGYGLTPEIVRLAKLSGPDILITVDNGIASVEGVAEARRLGMEVLITDHHLPGDALPDALCIVDPNQPGCDFPSKNLAGVGVMFYVLLALRAELRSRGAFADKDSPISSPGGKGEPNLGKLLDLVALGTVADVVKLDTNNRILVQQGLQRIRAGRACCGIQALLQVARKPAAQVSVYELGFIIGPRLNAAGRLQDMSLGIRCLLTDDPGEAAHIARQLDELNRTRREIEAGMQEAALAALEKTEASTSAYTLTLFDADWHQGVVGILASRLKDKFHRPTIAFARAQDGELKGSGRSIPGLHLRDALDLVSKRHPMLLQKFGGHAMAAGLSLHAADLSAFQAAFETVVQELLSPADLKRVIETDGSLQAELCRFETAQTLEEQVWGQGFPAPQFCDVFEVVQQRVVGEKHLKLTLARDAQRFEAMLFSHAATLPPRIEAVYRLSVNEYNGTRSLQLILAHWTPA